MFARVPCCSSYFHFVAPMPILLNAMNLIVFNCVSICECECVFRRVQRHNLIKFTRLILVWRCCAVMCV